MAVSKSKPEIEEIEKYRYIVSRFARKYSIRSSHREELLEELHSIGLLALLEALERYKDLSELHRARALSLRIRGEMLDHLSLLQKHRNRRESMTLEIQGSRSENPEYRQILSDVRAKLEVGFHELNEREYLILKHFLSTDVEDEATKISPSTRTKIKQRVFRRLRKHLSVHYNRSELLALLAE